MATSSGRRTCCISAFFFGTLILIPSRALIKISAPVLADAWKENDLKTIGSVYSKSCISQFIIGLFILICLWINIENVFRILPQEYQSGRYVILFVAIANLIEMLAGTSGMLIQTSRYYPYLTYFRGGSILVLILSNVILVPAFGITGAALAVLITRVFMTGVKFWLILKKFHLQPYDRKIVIVLAIGIFSFLPALLLPQLKSLILDIGIRTIIVSVLYLIGVLVFRPSEEINAEITNHFNRFRNFIKL